MKYFSSLIGGAVSGAIAFGVWPELWISYGIIGGWIAASLVIGTCWFMNHYTGVIWNPEGEAWIDMGFPIGVAGTVWSLTRFYPHNNIPDILPTLVCVLIGAGLGGAAASIVKRQLK